MSIATDEAEKKYPTPTDVDDPMYKYVEAIAGYPSAKRQGYVAGRTAEPTAAEINAAAKTLCERWNPGEWGTGFETADDDYRRDAEAMLFAAHKAVSE